MQDGVHVSGVKETVTEEGYPLAMSETGKDVEPWRVRLKF
jgi:hypothetical protein